MSKEQLIDNEFLQDHSELVMNSALASANASYEIKIDGSDRILNSSASRDSKTIYVVLILGVLAATGVPWMIINIPASPFNLGSVGTSHGNGPSSSPDQSSNAISDRMPEVQKGDRIPIHETVVGNLDRGALATTLQQLNLSSAASAGTASSKHSRGVQRRAEESRSSMKVAPTPETRPTTIPGWTLREVANGMALLEGPNGSWRVMPGQTVPGIGRVDTIVRWGNRLVVATSSGLISTP